MGSWRRMGAFLGLVPDDGDPGDSFDDADAGYPAAHSGDYGDDYGSSYGSDRAGGQNSHRRGHQIGRSGTSRAGEVGDTPDTTAPVTHGALAMQIDPDARRLPESAPAARPLTVKLTGFGEARMVGERYRDGASVILDMTDLTDADARRVVDFAAGLAFALRGSIDKVTARVFMLLPPHADFTDADRRAFAGSYADRYAASRRSR